MATRYQKESGKASELTGAGPMWPVLEVGEPLEDLVQRGAQEMLRRALEGIAGPSLPYHGPEVTPW